MINTIYNIFLAFLLWIGSYTIYMTCNHGIAQNARLQQLFRYFAASLVAIVPTTITETNPFQPFFISILITSGLWAITYPLAFHLTNRKSAPDYDHQIDPAFAIYLFGWLSAMSLYPYLHWAVSLALSVISLICIAQWVYYATCHNVLDVSGMKMLQETNYNEIIEFLQSYQPWRVFVVAIFMLGIVIGCFSITQLSLSLKEFEWWQHIIVAIVWCFISIYLFKPRRGLLKRTGIAQLYFSVKEYVEQNKNYANEQQQRFSNLNVRKLNQDDKPHTILMVIGESASRDFMSAYMEMKEDTTPWLRTIKEDSKHGLLYPNAYSCDIQTVPSLEKALTEFNQYNGGAFFSSCSIVDIAHKAGYYVHWYSNQGHLGAADTPITLVADTADVAKWTHQEIGKSQYDETLIDLLNEVKPDRNNFVVLHLKGSHFNYENRFTESSRQWGEPQNHDQITNYKNTLYYTDTVLKKAFDFCKNKLNLQAMVYFSDHADVPDRHRQPNFGGFRDTRIPLSIWLSDEYQSIHPERTEALKKNKMRYWTNDLVYELICGLLDIESNHFYEENSLASTKYKFSRDELTVMNGRIHITDDQYDISKDN